MLDSFGPNLSKRHPEVCRKGMVAKARAFFARGEYEAAHKELARMNLNHIKRIFDDDFRKKWLE
jgi:hypothetical protein